MGPALCWTFRPKRRLEYDLTLWTLTVRTERKRERHGDHDSGDVHMMPHVYQSFGQGQGNTQGPYILKPAYGLIREPGGEVHRRNKTCHRPHLRALRSLVVAPGCGGIGQGPGNQHSGRKHLAGAQYGLEHCSLGQESPTWATTESLTGLVKAGCQAPLPECLWLSRSGDGVMGGKNMHF